MVINCESFVKSLKFSGVFNISEYFNLSENQGLDGLSVLYWKDLI